MSDFTGFLVNITALVVVVYGWYLAFSASIVLALALLIFWPLRPLAVCLSFSAWIFGFDLAGAIVGLFRCGG